MISSSVLTVCVTVYVQSASHRRGEREEEEGEEEEGEEEREGEEEEEGEE